MNFLHSYHPDPIIFSIGPLQFYWYGFFVSLAIVLGIVVAQKLGKKYEIPKQQILDLAVYVIVFGFIGARIYDVFLEFPYYLKHPLDIFKVWKGGLAIHGGLIGGALAGYYFVKKNKLNFWLTADIVAVAIALGQAIGRWGNYFNQELYGLPTNLPWGIPIDFLHRPLYLYQNANYFHPTFLYESILNFCNFLFLLFLHKKRLLKKQSKVLALGNIFLVYLANYALIRFVLEFIKIDTTPILFGMRFPQLFSLLLFIFVVLGLRYKITKAKN
ncbi:prolipoprotein diacylglyceryl transferase [Candidatus Falkowbacteria bacterium]|nr:prolipoprotein diacylglyceryl transferase [Candidatus Falkowbacteria bacterium]MBT4432794.1 prolipoprotein diacylglyceryl transferase [Candidatus Falkowbacteria bacterium]